MAVLRDAGVAVDIGLMGEEARWLTAGHILRMTKGRPLVQLKIAVSGDGLIAPGEGAPVWVTGPEARAYAHLLRAHADAVMVGRKTVEDDDPELTCRLPGPRQPLAAARRSRPQVPHLASSSRCSRPRSACRSSSSAPPARTPPAYPPGVEARQVPVDAGGRLDLEAVCQSLAKDGVTRVLVEGGPTISGALLAADLADEVVIARGTEPLGAPAASRSASRAWRLLDDTRPLAACRPARIGTDTLTLHRRTGRFAEGGGA